MQIITIEQARQYYDGADSAHDFHHVLRVLGLAERIGAAEGADMEILRTATLLHDMARADELRDGVCHAQAGAEKARQILDHWPSDRVDAVAHAIACHRFRDSAVPQTLEARVLYDADKLDCIGAIGVARAYAVGGLTGQRLWTEVDPEHLRASLDNKAPVADKVPPDYTPVHEFALKLSRVKDTLFTRQGKAMAEVRHRFMVEFFARLEAEAKGEL